MSHADTMLDLIDKIHIAPDQAAVTRLLSTMMTDASHRPVRVAFVNAHAVNMCYTNPAFLKDLLACDYILRDGSGMKILYKLLGRDPGLNLNGTDLIPTLVEMYKGQSAALLGTEQPYLGRAADRIAERGVNIGLQVDGFRNDQDYVDLLRGQPSSLVILAMGMPKQERVAAQIAVGITDPCLIICGGAILDFLGEKVQRAPDYFRRNGLEWVYRLLQEPRRMFRRYLIGNFVFVYRSLKLAAATRA